MQYDASRINERPKHRPKPRAQSVFQQPFQATWFQIWGSALISQSDGVADLLEYFLDFGDHESAAGSLYPRHDAGEQQKLVNCRDFTQSFEPGTVEFSHAVISAQPPGGVNLRPPVKLGGWSFFCWSKADWRLNCFLN